MVKTFSKILSSNISVVGKECAKLKHSIRRLYQVRIIQTLVYALFSMEEMIRALKKTKPTPPGKDQICYLLMKNLDMKALKKLLFDKYSLD